MFVMLEVGSQQIENIIKTLWKCRLTFFGSFFNLYIMKNYRRIAMVFLALGVMFLLCGIATSCTPDDPCGYITRAYKVTEGLDDRYYFEVDNGKTYEVDRYHYGQYPLLNNWCDDSIK